jgi:hypothetical protein
LAQNIVERNDNEAVRELVDNLKNRDRNIQSDCVKVLYEIGERKPALIADLAEEFSLLLDNKNNRLVWGAMTALDSITLENPKSIYRMLAKIVYIADDGSVITRDHAVSILTKLASLEQYADKVVPLLVEQLKHCPTNQLPMYAENALPIITERNKTVFIKTLNSRLADIEKESKRKRVEKVIDKLNRSSY